MSYNKGCTYKWRQKLAKLSQSVMKSDYWTLDCTIMPEHGMFNDMYLDEDASYDKVSWRRAFDKLKMLCCHGSTNDLQSPTTSNIPAIVVFDKKI